jgi:hypothetical protein
MPFTASPHHVGLSVADLDAEQHWYQKHLGLAEVIERVELPDPPVRTVVLRAPSGLRLELIELAGHSRPQPMTRSRPRAPRPTGTWRSTSVTLTSRLQNSLRPAPIRCPRQRPALPPASASPTCRILKETYLSSSSPDPLSEQPSLGCHDSSSGTETCIGDRLRILDAGRPGPLCADCGTWLSDCHGWRPPRECVR